MEYLATASKLETYTIYRATKDIPKAYTFTLKNQLCASARKINQYVTYAEATMVKQGDTPASEKRLSYLASAYAETKNLLEILKQCDEILTIKETVLEDWVCLIVKEQSAIAKERKSLIDRFKVKD